MAMGHADWHCFQEIPGLEAIILEATFVPVKVRSC